MVSCHTVEVDESLFSRRKNHQGRQLPQQSWMQNYDNVRHVGGGRRHRRDGFSTLTIASLLQFCGSSYGCPHPKWKKAITLSIGDTRVTPLELQTTLMEIANKCNERPIGLSEPWSDWYIPADHPKSTSSRTIRHRITQNSSITCWYLHGFDWKTVIF